MPPVGFDRKEDDQVPSNANSCILLYYLLNWMKEGNKNCQILN
jgi:hypothetical protein